MQAVLDTVAPIFGLILAGYACHRMGLLGDAATDQLNAFVVWLALPAVLFGAMAQITWAEIDHPGFLAAVGGGMVATYALSLGLDRRRHARLADASIEGLDAAYPNTGFMGVPLCLAVFGTAGLPPAVIATLFASLLLGVAIALIEIDLQAERNLGRTVRKVAVSLARNPIIVAPLAGMLVAALGIHLSSPVLRFTTLLGGAASPCALVTLGLFLAQARSAAPAGVVARLVGLKLVVQPAVTAALAFGVFGMPPLWSHTAVILSALPIGTGPFMLAKHYDREAGVTSRAILFSTVLSIGTISFLISVLGRV